jgi:hypothetical protein
MEYAGAAFSNLACAVGLAFLPEAGGIACPTKLRDTAVAHALVRAAFTIL